MAKPKTKEDDSPKSVLQNVLTGRQPTRMLLNDREFQLRAQQICKQIKRSPDCDDLIADVNLRVLQSGSTLKRANLKNENQFFRWFIAVAKNLHRRSTMKSCNEKARHWPNSTAYLSAVELDGFFAHADVCPYHRAILEAEETEQDQRFASMLKSVRGLDAHGRILGLQHLRATVADLKRRMAMRNGKALADGFPFQSIGVYNDGRRIALASSSFDPISHWCTHQLNPLAGLQIRGITGPKPEDYVPLGFYPLDGVRHLDTEHHLHLPNGYTVGLSIEQHSETSFTVGFKCVKSEAIKQTRARTAWDKQAGRKVFRTGITPAFVANAISGVKHHPIRYANAAAVTILLTLLLLPAFRSPQSGGEGTKQSKPLYVGLDASLSLPPIEQQDERTPVVGDLRNKTHLRAAHVSNHVQLLIDTQIGTAGSNLDLLPRTPDSAHEVENRPKGKQVEETTTWVLQMYETGPHTTERLVVTHYADSERLKDELENLVPDSSLRLVLITDPEQSAQRPNTGNEVYWKTNYQNEKIASVEATVFRRDSGDPTVPSIKQTCSVVGCDDWMLIANAISNVYEIINRDWKPTVIFAAGKMNGCWFRRSGLVLQNGLTNTGVSGGEFDELDLCPASAEKGTR